MSSHVFRPCQVTRDVAAPNRIPLRLTGQANVIGADATVAAWTEDQSWLDAVMDHLPSQGPEATYLAWLNCRELRLSAAAFQFFLNKAQAAATEPAKRSEPSIEAGLLD